MPSFPPAALPTLSSPKSQKSLWIGTGIAAALLAMVGLAIGLPHVFGTHAAESTSSEASPAVSSHPSPVSDTSPAASSAPQDLSNETPPAGHTDQVPGLQPPGTTRPLSHSHNAEVAAPPSASPQPPPHQELIASPPSTSAVDLDQASDRYTELSARAGAVDASLAHLRTQQQAEGYGLRGDMESADNRMQTYLRAADQDLHSSDPTSATRDLARAEEALKTLEKFLGH